MKHLVSLSLSAGLFCGLCAVLLTSSVAFAVDHNGSQLPLSIPQNTFDHVAKKGKFDSRGSLTHWVACGHTIDFFQTELATAKADLALCEAGGVPSECEKPKFPDGSGGALWKPVAEGGAGGSHATFLGSNAIQKVELLDSSGAVVETLKLRYYNGPGARSVWDTRGASSSLPGALTIRAYYAEKCEDRALPDPTQRVD